ncbi:MAG: cobyrinate a,c-diamide synthase [Pseudomonadota bacterium]
MQNAPRIIIGALRGGSGKTLISIGVTAALRRRGLSIAVFKKGPDYIDAGWLGKAAQRPCRNLDSYLFDKETLKKSFCESSKDQDISIIEGNRGLFDGVNASGEYSSAELAKLLKTPVILIVDASKMTRTAAALVLGCQSLDPDVLIKAVILNRVAGPRHEKTLRDSIEDYCSIPVIGAINKLSLENFPQRHLGLLPLSEHSAANEIVDTVGNLVERSIDLDELMKLARAATPFCCQQMFEKQSKVISEHENLKIGILRDSAFQFYYPENLQALTSTGASLVEITALEPRPLPPVDALYIGGGFPETHAEVLANNTIFKQSLLSAIKTGLPVYAECGGLMYLARQLTVDETTYPMVGVFDVETVLERRPQGHGYMVVNVVVANPFFPVGSVLKGHEFHYSFIPSEKISSNSYAFKVIRGHGINGSLDGIFRYRTLGTYLHLHSLGTPSWASAILKQAQTYHEMSFNYTNGQSLSENYSFKHDGL